MLSRRHILGFGALSALTTACEAIGLKATVVSSKTVNGKTTTRVREARNWDEFESAMGEVATDFSDVAKQVGATTAELLEKLVDAPPPGKVALGQLSPSLKPYEGDVRYDYLTVARANPDTPYDFTYVQIGMPEYDNFFRSSAEMYAAAYQLMETGRHVHLAAYRAQGADAPSDVVKGDRKILRREVETSLKALADPRASATDGVNGLRAVWTSMVELGATFTGKAAEMAQAGASLVTSAPTQILNPKLVLHIKLIIKGLEQSVGMVMDTGKLLAGIVA